MGIVKPIIHKGGGGSSGGGGSAIKGIFRFDYTSTSSATTYEITFPRDIDPYKTVFFFDTVTTQKPKLRYINNKKAEVYIPSAGDMHLVFVEFA